MDTTNHVLLDFIASHPNKSHFRVRNAVKVLETEISELRIYTYKNRRETPKVCSMMNQRANYLEKRLREALNNVGY